MNAFEIIARVHEYDADLVLRDGKLIVQGRGGRLPDRLQEDLRAHKAEVMVALGGSIDAGVREVLAELRPNLPLAMRTLSEDKLLILVNWSIIAAWEKTIRFAVRP